MSKITAAMICKNEHEYIPYALWPALEFADKIVVVFTGKQHGEYAEHQTYDSLLSIGEYAEKRNIEFKIINHEWTGCHATARRKYVPHLDDGWFWMIDADEIWYYDMVIRTINLLSSATSDYLYVNEKSFKNTHFTCGHRYTQRVRWMRIDWSKYTYDIAGSHIADDLCRISLGSVQKYNIMPAYGQDNIEYAGGEECRNRIHYLHMSLPCTSKHENKVGSIEWPARDLLVAFPGPYPHQCNGMKTEDGMLLKKASWLIDAGVTFSTDATAPLIDPYMGDLSWNEPNERITW